MSLEGLAEGATICAALKARKPRQPNGRKDGKAAYAQPIGSGDAVQRGDEEEAETSKQSQGFETSALAVGKH